MLNDQQAHDFLHTAGDDVAAGFVDPVAVVQGGRHRRRRRVVAVLGMAVVVGAMTVGGIAWHLDSGNGRAAVADPYVTSPGQTVGHPRNVDPVINTTNWTPGDPYMRALVGGLLQMDAHGCLFASTRSGQRLDLLWPKDFKATRLPDGSVVVEDPAGKVMATVGSSFSAAGGNGPAPAHMTCRAGPPSSDVVAVQAEFQQGPHRTNMREIYPPTSENSTE